MRAGLIEINIAGERCSGRFEIYDDVIEVRHIVYGNRIASRTDEPAEIQAKKELKYLVETQRDRR